jgi:D-3-phosphoglycerate dehydrogenase
VPETQGSERSLQIARALRDAAAVVVGHDRIDAAIIAGAPELKVIVKQGIGVDNIDLPAATGQGVLVVNAPGTNVESVADLTFALILAVARRLIFAHNLVASGGWSRVIGAEVWGKCLGIVGFGNIGQRVARRATGFSMNVAYYDVVAYPDVERDWPGLVRMELAELLGWADFVTLHLPLTDATCGLVGERELALMKPTAYLINTSRGGVVDEEALYKVLKERKIAGAALDVFVQEPPADRKMLQLSNVITTPHMGAYTVEANDRVCQHVAQSVLDALEHRLPKTALNPEALAHRGASEAQNADRR